MHAVGEKEASIRNQADEPGCNCASPGACKPPPPRHHDPLTAANHDLRVTSKVCPISDLWCTMPDLIEPPVLTSWSYILFAAAWASDLDISTTAGKKVDGRMRTSAAETPLCDRARETLNHTHAAVGCKHHIIAHSETTERTDMC